MLNEELTLVTADESAQARAEREAIEAKAIAEANRLRDEARKEREELDAIAKKDREAREKLEAEIAAKKVAEAKDKADRLATLEAAALAPEKEKLKALAAAIRELPMPVLTTEKGAVAMQEIAAKVEAFAAWIEKKSGAL